MSSAQFSIHLSTNPIQVVPDFSGFNLCFFQLSDGAKMYSVEPIPQILNFDLFPGLTVISFGLKHISPKGAHISDPPIALCLCSAL